MRKSIRAAGAVIVCALTMTACGSSSDSASSTTTSMATTTTAHDMSTMTTAASGSGTAMMSGTIKVTLTDFMIAPMGFNVKAGDVTFEVVNNGDTPHNFSVESTDGNKIGGTKNLTKGQTETITIKIPAGTYNAVCTLPGHESLGMKEPLTAS